MKSKFGFIPIVLPVLVMVLIIGLINIGSAPWVQAHDPTVPDDTAPHGDPEHRHNVGENHPRLSGITVFDSSTDAAIPGGALMPDFDADVSSYKVSATYDVEAITLTATAGDNASDTEGDRSYKIKRPGQRVLEGTEATIPSFDIPVGVTTMVEIKVITNGLDAVTSPHTIYMVEITREYPQFATLVLNQARDALTETAVPLDDDATDGAADVLMGESSLMGNDAKLRDTKVDVKVKYHVEEIGLSLTIPDGLNGAVADTSTDDAVSVAFGNIPINDVIDNGEAYEVLKRSLNVGDNNRIDIRVSATTTPEALHAVQNLDRAGEAAVGKRELPARRRYHSRRGYEV